MKVYWTALLCLGCAAPPAVQSAHSGVSPSVDRGAPDFGVARQIIRDGMAKDSVPAVAVAITRGDSILWEEGFGYANRETHTPATAHTPFYLASVTKTLTTTAAMVLRERGLLDLDRPANDYLGSSHLTSPAWSANGATVRRLANHTSGLTTFDLGCSGSCNAPSHDDIIRDYGVIMWPPGEQFDYSNLGYLVLGDIVGRVAHTDLGTVLREDLFRPLGMTDASLGIDPRRAGETAVQYSWTRGALQPNVIVSGGSSAYGSAHDLALFGMLHVKSCRCTAGSVLSNASIDTMQASVVSAGGSSQYGLGWWVEADRFGYRSFLAQGGTDAATAWLRIIPSEHITAVVLANKGVGFPSDAIDAMIGALLPDYAKASALQHAGAAVAAPRPTLAPALLDENFVGAWRGVVRTERGDVALSFSVADSGTLRAAIGGAPIERVGRASYSAATLRLVIPGDLDTADSTAGQRLSFYLHMRDGRLNGAVTTIPRASSRLTGRVSYWVEFRKER